MLTLQELNRQIQSAEELRSVVTTMKNLAAVNIRQYQRAVESLGDYAATIEDGLHVALRSGPGIPVRAGGSTEASRGAIVIGSDQGMVGDFNERIARFAIERLTGAGGSDGAPLMVAGFKAAAVLASEGFDTEEVLPLPGSVEGVVEPVGRLLVTVEEWRRAKAVEEITIFYNESREGAAYRPRSVRLSPVDTVWLEELRDRQWSSRTLPIHTMDRLHLLSRLLREYIFVVVYRAFAESLASENATRLASMQAAERNIEERLDELGERYNYRRQSAITAEMLDIAAGFEVLREDAP